MSDNDLRENLMGSLIFAFFEWVARITGIPVRVSFTIVTAFGIFHAYNELGPFWAFGIWVPIWAMFMYIYRNEHNDN